MMMVEIVIFHIFVKKLLDSQCLGTLKSRILSLEKDK